MKKTMKRNKAAARAAILYDPTSANAGPVWAWHAAPEWEKQVQPSIPSLFAQAEFAAINRLNLPTVYVWERVQKFHKRFEP